MGRPRSEGLYSSSVSSFGFLKFFLMTMYYIHLSKHSFMHTLVLYCLLYNYGMLMMGPESKTAKKIKSLDVSQRLLSSREKS